MVRRLPFCSVLHKYLTYRLPWRYTCPCSAQKKEHLGKNKNKNAHSHLKRYAPRAVTTSADRSAIHVSARPPTRSVRRGIAPRRQQQWLRSSLLLMWCGDGKKPLVCDALLSPDQRHITLAHTDYQ